MVEGGGGRVGRAQERGEVVNFVRGVVNDLQNQPVLLAKAGDKQFDAGARVALLQCVQGSFRPFGDNHYKYSYHKRL